MSLSLINGFWFIATLLIICFGAGETQVKDVLKPHFWTDCRLNRTKEICKNYGFEYIDSSTKGVKDRDECKHGKRVLCGAPNPVPLTNTAAHNLKVLSYNIFERDFFISHDGQRERTCRIPYWIAKNLPDVDVICFQEVFMGGCWHNQVTLRDLLAYYGFNHFTDTVNNARHIQPGGVFLASKWPIIETTQYIFSNSSLRTFDFLSAKGVSYAKILKKKDGISKKYNIMSTHLNAETVAKETRQLQVIEMNEFIESLKLPKNEPLIVGGDFNVNYIQEIGQIERMLSNLNAHWVFIEGRNKLPFTIDPDTNDLVKEMDKKHVQMKEWLDYIFYIKGYKLPKSARMYAIDPHSEEPFPICWCEQCSVKLLTGYLYPGQKLCPQEISISYLSDHHGVVGEFEFTKYV